VPFAAEPRITVIGKADRPAAIAQRGETIRIIGVPKRSA
jgi:hypothetical protein